MSRPTLCSKYLNVNISLMTKLFQSLNKRTPVFIGEEDTSIQDDPTCPSTQVLDVPARSTISAVNVNVCVVGSSEPIDLAR